MKLRHYDHDGCARFVTFCTHRRIPVLTNDGFRGVVVNAIDVVRVKSRFGLIAYVIMPEHVHLVIVPPEEIEVGVVVGEIKQLSAREIHKVIRNRDLDLVRRLSVLRGGARKFALWQRRCYDHNCRSEESVWEKVNYCHNNPVSRALVRCPEDWRWSSCQWYQGKRDGPLAMDIDVES